MATSKEIILYFIRKSFKWDKLKIYMNIKKGVVVLSILFVATILYLSFLTAAVNTTINIGSFENSSACLRTQIDAKGYSSLTVEELVFSILALGYDSSRQSALKTELDKRKDANNACWPANACTVKETSQVMLAYVHINADTNLIKSWLMNQTISATDLVWYLQIETNNQSQCTIQYDNSTRTISLAENKQVSGTFGNCLRLSDNGYWLQILPSCYNKEFEISCNDGFLVSTFYKRMNSEVIYITDTTKTTSINSKITTKVESLCFKQGSSCNYEASLWATYVITKKDSTLKNKVLPYLIALYADSVNQRYFPSAFLYSLTTANEYLTALVNLQNIRGYWQISDANRRYYDTALALMALSGQTGSAQTDLAIQYLLDPAVASDGCYNGDNIRDTAFIIYAASPRPASSGGGLTPMSQCSDYSAQGYACTSSLQCDTLNGTALPNFNCYGGFICCNKAPVEETCSAQSGTKCLSSEECSVELISASDSSSCCPSSGECNDKPINVLTDCEQASYTCKETCSPTTEEETNSFSCNGFDVCCTPKQETPKSYWWLILLILLIILVILAIIFRNQLRVWWFKVTSKFQKGPVSPQTRPTSPSYPGQRPMMPPQMMQRRFVPGQPNQPMRPMPPAGPMARPFPKDKELADTLKKLKDMGK